MSAWENVTVSVGAGAFPWGKHKGKQLADVPRDYLEWALRDADMMKPDLRHRIEEFLGLPIGSTGPPPSTPGDVKLGEVAANALLSDEEKLLIKQMKTSWGKDQTRLMELERENANLRAELAIVRHDVPSDLDLFRRIVKQWFAAMSRRFHPDLGGNAEKQTIVNLLYRDLISRLETTCQGSSNGRK